MARQPGNFNKPLLFLRHGATDWNLQGRYQGLQDTELSRQGLEDARENARILRDLVENGTFERGKLRIITSPLKRATQTAQIISDDWSPALPVQAEEAFRELSMGRWEGMTSMEVKLHHYEERRQRKSDRWNFKPVNGESMAGRRSQIEGALSALPAHSVVVTHSVVLKVIFHLLGGLREERAALERTPHRSIWCWNGAKLHRQG